jgi:hypothetical protein
MKQPRLEVMALTQAVFGVRKHGGHGWLQSVLFVTDHGYHPLAQLGNGSQEVDKGTLTLLAQPATAQGQTRLQFPHYSQLGFAPFWCQPVQTQDRARLLRHLLQVPQILPLVASQQGQVTLVIQMAHLRLADLNRLGPTRVGYPHWLIALWTGVQSPSVLFRVISSGGSHSLLFLLG